MARLGEGLTEAESLDPEVGFVVATNPHASGGAMLQAAGAASASGVFDGPSGLYTLSLGYFDESDGVATMTVRVNGSLIDTWDWDGSFGTVIVTPESRAVRHIPNVALEPGDRIEIAGAPDGGEPLRTDWIEIAPQAPSAADFRIEAEDLSIVSGFFVNTNPHASDGAMLQASGSGEQRAGFIFSNAAGRYAFTVGYFDETDGVSTMSVAINGEVVDAWRWDGAFGSSIVTPECRAERAVGQFDLKPGDRIEFIGQADGGEPLRTDWLSFRAVGDATPDGLLVDTADDVVDPADGVTSLREAVAYADAEGGTVRFAAEAFGGPAQHLLRLTKGALAVSGEVTVSGDVDGDGAPDIVVSADAAGDDVLTTDARGSVVTDAHQNLNTDDNSRIFYVQTGASLTLEDIVLTGGYGYNGGAITALGDTYVTIRGGGLSGNAAIADGGGLRSAGASVVISDALISLNVADAGGGGGVWSTAPIELNGVETSGNRAGTHGGGMYALGGMEAVDVAFVDNYTALRGSALYHRMDVTMTNATIAGNTAATASSIYGHDSVYLANVTITGNQGGSVHTGYMEIGNSIIMRNRDDLIGEPDVNLRPYTHETGPNLYADSDPAEVFAFLDPATGGGVWGDYGGVLPSVALRADPSNPALDAGDDNLADVAFDIRGGSFARIVDLPEVEGAGLVDLGSFELQALLF